ncbi:hypothetical protein FKM82_013775 [Ascaphus truei]
MFVLLYFACFIALFKFRYRLLGPGGVYGRTAVAWHALTGLYNRTLLNGRGGILLNPSSAREASNALHSKGVKNGHMESKGDPSENQLNDNKLWAENVLGCCSNLSALFCSRDPTISASVH